MSHCWNRSWSLSSAALSLAFWARDVARRCTAVWAMVWIATVAAVTTAATVFETDSTHVA